MLKMIVFSVFDSKAQVFSQPMFAPTEGVAIRTFSNAANDPQSEISLHPEDYILFRVGEWDAVAGELVGCLPSSLCSASQFNKKAD